MVTKQRRPPAVALLPEEPGVYRFRDARGAALYVGRAGNLRRRVGSYWGELADRRHLVRMIPKIARIEALVCDSEHEAAWAERNLLQRRLPRWNRSRGEDTPVHLRLDPSPGSPRLDVVHSPDDVPGGAIFGPYLGGNKVRAAASGIHRVYPIAYLGTGASAAEREFARLRGVGPVDLTRLTDAVAAVLDRDDAAVGALLDALAALRGRAAAGEGYELAARLQEEIEAVGWVVARQRAATVDGGDADFTGWADGMLLRVEFRGGRLCGWEQRACAHRPAADEPAGQWAAFLARNAALAAALTAQRLL